MTQLDTEGVFCGKIRTLAQEQISLEPWTETKYHPDRLNDKDRIVSVSEEIADELESMLLQRHLISRKTGYLEVHVDEVL